MVTCRQAGSSRSTSRSSADPFTHVKSGRSGIDKRPAAGPVRLEVDGVVGDTVCDKHHGGPEQAVYAYAVEDLDFWTDALRARRARQRRGEPHDGGRRLLTGGDRRALAGR